MKRNKTKWLLLNPPIFETFFKSPLSKNISIPLGLAYLASVLKKNDALVKIFDISAMSMKTKSVMDFIKSENPDVIGIYCSTPNVGYVRALFRNVEDRNTLKVVGGPHPTQLPADLLDVADVCIIGEGESTVVELNKYINNEISNLGDIYGLCFKKNNETCYTGNRELIEDINSIPFPARELLPAEKYSFEFPIVNMQGKYFAEMILSRGCPFKCKFCCSPRNWMGKIRFRNIENIISEIESLLQNNYFFIHFIDDVFNLIDNRVIELCEIILKKRLNFKWSCIIRADLVKKNILKLMKKAGCVQVQVGIESGEQKILDIMGKNVKLEEIRKGFSLIKSVGLQSKGFFIIGYTEETRESIIKSIKFAKLIEPTYITISIFTPYPESFIFKALKEKNLLLTENWSDYVFYKTPVFKNKFLSSRDIVYFRKIFLIKFYLRVKIIKRLFFIFVQQPAKAFQLVITYFLQLI